MEDYTRYNGRRKPELIDPSTFSVRNYHEADRVYDEWKSLSDRVDELAKQLPADERASYFELIQYPVDACANLTEMYIAAARIQMISYLRSIREPMPMPTRYAGVSTTTQPSAMSTITNCSTASGTT